MKTLTIVRGLPGSGKSTVAKTLSALFDSNHVEADMFFLKKINGEERYDFDATRLKDAHAWCRDRVEYCMQADEPVVVANTFTRQWEITPYIDLAKNYGYTVQMITVEGRFENIHGVPSDIIQSMKTRFQHLTLEDFGL